MLTLCCLAAQLCVHFPDQQLRRLTRCHPPAVGIGEPDGVALFKVTDPFARDPATDGEQVQLGRLRKAHRVAGPQPRAVQRGIAVMQGDGSIMPGYA